MGGMVAHIRTNKMGSNLMFKLFKAGLWIWLQVSHSTDTGNLSEQFSYWSRKETKSCILYEKEKP